ncbi:armadillo-type protein [Gongronella butleri]|nr:armadillo-type protein [Gongronella butleri]
MGQDERIQYYASLCEQLYNPSSNEKRLSCQEELEREFPTFTDAAPSKTPSLVIHTPTETAQALRILLEACPTDPYVQTFCFSRLRQLISSQFSIFDTDTKKQLRAFLLQYAYDHPSLPPFIVVLLGGVFALLSKLGWLDMEEYQQIQPAMGQFLSTSMEHRIMATQLLTVIVQDFNAPASTPYASMFRKASSGFRDTQLLPVFKMAFKTLEDLVARQIPFSNAEQEARLKEGTAQLLVQCLSYDFTGTSLDESGEDIGTVQIPTSWRKVFEQEHFLPTFFRAYQEWDTPCAARIMECLVLLASTRKALFTSDQERDHFVQTIMQATQAIILQSQGMNDEKCYNEFCRLLFRFRSMAPLHEIAEKPAFEQWIELVADFTVQAFQSWNWSHNTSSYLLGFWSRLVESMAYQQNLKGDIKTKLQSISVLLVRTYILSYVQSVPNRIVEMLDDPLDDEEALVESLIMLGKIARLQYENSSSVLLSVFDPIAVEYQELVAQMRLGAVTEQLKNALDVIETKFAWLTYFASVFVGSRPAYATSDEVDAVDGEVTAKVLQLMEANQSLLRVQGSSLLNAKLDSAFIYFFQQFRKAYIGEASATAVYNKTSEMFGISGQLHMLDVIMQKIVSNFQCWRDDEVLIKRTLDLFGDLASGYSALRNLRKIETVQYLLRSSMLEDGNPIQFLDEQRRCRMVYYTILCKILFAEDIDEDAFDTFISRFEKPLDDLNSLTTLDSFHAPRVQQLLHDTFRDLRGVLTSLQSKKHFSFFFSWFYPDYMQVVLRGLEACCTSIGSSSPTVTDAPPAPMLATTTLVIHSLLKFIAELVQNKNSRLNFDISSPNGLLLFKDTSRALNIYGRYILERTAVHPDRIYQEKYKGITICFRILANCLGGNYISFGSLWLYQDDAIDQAFQMMFQLMMSIPMNDLLNFPKLTKAYFLLVDEFALSQLKSIPMLPMEPFVFILESCEQGVRIDDPYIRTHASATLDHVLTFVIEQEASLVKKSRKNQRRSSWCLEYVKGNPHLMASLLVVLFGMVLFDTNNDQWQLSRPLYVLMLLQKDVALKYTNQVVYNQLPERKEYVANAFKQLLDGIGWTLARGDREAFSRKVLSFRRELNANQITLSPLSAPMAMSDILSV